MKTLNEIHSFLTTKYGQRYATVLSQKLGVSKSIISQTLNGHQFNYETREKIAADSGMTSDEFFEPVFDALVGLVEWPQSDPRGISRASKK